jgi:hypothetical protein
MATRVRSPDERPLSMGIVRRVRRLFSHAEADTFWLATLWLFLRFYLVERVHPNQQRYWKKIYTDEKRLRRLYLALEKIDRILKRIPGMRRFAWNVAIVATK